MKKILMLLVFGLCACSSTNSDLHDMGYKDKFTNCNALVLENEAGTTLIEVMCTKNEPIHILNKNKQ